MGTDARDDVEAATSGLALHSLCASDASLREFVAQLRDEAVVYALRALEEQPGRSNLIESRRCVLVTGSQGLLGSALVLLLRGMGMAVRGIDVVRGDTTDIVGSVADREIVRKAMDGCDACVHCASLHAPHAHHCDEHTFERINVCGTENVVAACSECGCSRLVYISTTSIG